MIYLDSAATTLQKPPEVALAAARAIGRLASPGRGGHPAAMEAAETAYRCRMLAGELFGVAEPERVVFTLNATHALNIAIGSLVRPGDSVVISGWEHNAVTRPLRALGAEVRVARGALFDPERVLREMETLVDGSVTCVVCTQVSNVFGMVLPIPEIARLCAAREVPLMVDASQGAGCLPIDLDGWGAAFVGMPGHKGLYGPQGTGLLLCGRDRLPEPVLYGGTGSVSLSQEMPDFLPDRLEAGTHNMVGIAGLYEGLKFVFRKDMAAILRHETELVRAAGEGLGQLPGIEVLGAGDPRRQAGVLSFRVTGRDCEDVAGWLGEQGVAVRAGLHCAPLAHRSAGTLETGTVRISFSAFNSLKEVRQFVALMDRFVRGKGV